MSSYKDIPVVQPGSESAESQIVDFLRDIQSRKEFAELNYDDQYEGEHFMKRLLQMHGPQLFVKNFMNLNTPYKRLFINWQTGTGKTIAALGIAREFVSRQSYGRKKIFIVGFTKSLFIAELLMFPSFGFITFEERDRLNKLREAEPRTPENKQFTNMMAQFKRRITDKGYQKFYGYKELALRLFKRTEKGVIEKFEWKSLFAQSILKKNEFLSNLKKQIDLGYVRINTDLMDSMRNSLLIADEIHDLYNMETENNYGISIQYILDTLESNAPYTVLMSATPMTGSASEVIDLLNLLVEKRFLPNKEHLRKEDFFDGNTPKHGALEKIGQLSAGRVSFLIDINEAKYPKRIFQGESVESVPYLKLIQCPMSDFQKLTLKNSSMHSFIYDFAFPYPERDYGVTNTTEYREVYQNGSQSMLKKLGVEVMKSTSDFYVGGRFLSNLTETSPKYQKMVEILLNIIKNDEGKIMIFHPKVHLTGVLFIQQVLIQHGFIDETSMPIDTTRCCMCAERRKDHDQSHEYIPARFITLHSGLDSNMMTGYIDKFNMLNNLYGQKYKIIIGSRVIRQGYNFKAVRHQLIMSLPDNYPILLQIYGRCIRRGSAIELPEHLRNVNIYNLVSTSDSSNSELDRYIQKGEEYKIIQKVERVLRMYSIDGFLVYPSIKSMIPTIDSVASLESLPFTSKNLPALPQQLATYYAYGYGQKEVEAIINIIWVAFSMYPVWKYDDLWAAITTHKMKDASSIALPSFGYKLDMIDRGSFDLALFYMSGRVSTLGTNIPYTLFKCGEYIILSQTSTSGPILSPEIYIRSKLQNTVQTRQVIQISEPSEKSEDISKIISFIETEKFPELALVSFTANDQYEMLKAVVSGEVESSAVIALYRRFKVLLTVKEISKNKKVSEGLSLPSDPKAVVGIVERTSVLIWTNSEFKSIALKEYTKPREENDFIVGVVDEGQFKLKEIPKQKSSDLRKQVRGAVCETRPKEMLLRIISQLRPLVEKTKTWKDIALNKRTTPNLCLTIKMMLLSLEENARAENGPIFVRLLEN